MNMRKNWMMFLGIFSLSLVVYLIFCKKEFEVLNYFLPLANSILHGKIDISCALPLNELVNISGKCFVVYPPAPAIALIPFALIWGDKISQVYPGIIYASLAGGIFYLYLSHLTTKKHAAILSIFLMFGTNFFLTNLIGRSWYFAHVLSVFFLALALLFAVKKKAFWAGLFVALAGMSRLPILLAFPALLYLIKPTKKDYLKFFAPYIAVVVLFLVYNKVRFGSPFQTGYSLIPGVLDEPWYQQGIFSISYIPRNLQAMLLSFPVYTSSFPWLIPTTTSMALWLTSPALLLLGYTLKNKLSLVMMGTFVLVILTDLMHGAVGFSQFGYRFSLDGILLFITALIPVLKTRVNLTYSLIALSILINFYVVFEYALGFFRP